MHLNAAVKNAIFIYSEKQVQREMVMKKAFTLAEVLLTLAVIGVVAALTIPAVITKVSKDQYVTALKKAFNTVKTVEASAIGDMGSRQAVMSYSHMTSHPFYENVFKPYLDVLKDCGMATDEGCFAYEYKYLNGEIEETNFANQPAAYKILTSDGIALSFQISNPYDPSVPDRVVGHIYVDVNGVKGPNTYGRDHFHFYIYGNDKGIKPVGHDQEPPSCAGGRGYGCTAKVLLEGAMNY